MSTPHQVRLEQKSVARWAIEIDGVDVADIVRRGSGRLEFGDGKHLPVLSLDLVLWPGFGADVGTATVEIDGKARETLLALGWTPPPDDPEQL